VADKYMVNTTAVSHRFGDDVVLVHPETDRVFLLNLTSARIWELLCQNNQQDTIERILFNEFYGQPDQIKEDIVRIISELQAEKFINILKG
jgi:hypothetical protein